MFKWHCFFQELIENINKSELPKSDYSCKNELSPPVQGGSAKGGQRTQTTTSNNSRPARSRRTANWGRSRQSDDGYSRLLCYLTETEYYFLL